MKVRKKPVEIEAWLWAGDTSVLTENGVLWQSVAARSSLGRLGIADWVEIWNEEDKMWLRLDPDSWCMQGVKGEHYPCTQEVFDRTYEIV